LARALKKVLKKALKKVLKKVLFGESTQKSTQISTQKSTLVQEYSKKYSIKQYKNHKTQKSTFETYSKKYSGSISKKIVLFLHFYSAVLLFLLPLAQFSEHFELTFMGQNAKLSRPASIG